jgi:hypothetical protein
MRKAKKFLGIIAETNLDKILKPAAREIARKTAGEARMASRLWYGSTEA